MSEQTQEYRVQSGINTRARAKKINDTINNSVDSAVMLNSQIHGERKKHRTMVLGELTENENGLFKSVPLVTITRFSGTLPKDYNWNAEKELSTVSTPTLVESIATKTPKKSLLVKRSNSKTNSRSPKLTIPSRMINCTPRRSTKTPKKSPKNLSSPKTCSTTPLRLSKTPRKLTLMVEPPKICQEDATVSETSLEESIEVPDSNRHRRLPTTKKKMSNKASSTSIKEGIRRFSTSPKRILRTPKLKSKPDLKVKKTNGILVKKTSTSTSVSDSENPVKIKWNFPPKNLHDEEIRPAESSDINISEKQALPLKNLVVVLHRLPSINGNVVKRWPLTEITSTPNTKSTVTDSSILSSSTKSNLLKKSLKYQESTPVATPYKSILKPTKSSTPWDNKEMDGMKSNRSPLRSFKLGIENESVPSLQDIDDTIDNGALKASDASRDVTFVLESEQATETKNGTYELLEPKTPDLRERLRKRTFSPNDNEFPPKDNVVQESPKIKVVKKTRFKSSTPNHNSPSIVINDRTVHTPYSAVKPIGNISRRENSTLSKIKSTPGSIRKRPRSIGPLSASRLHQGSNSAIEAKRAKKIPDFSSIHKKLFAKSESVVDAKQRLAERHKALTKIKMDLSKTKITPTKTSRLANDTTKGPYNRFGFKVRKNEATDYVLKKTNAVPRNTKQAENRAILKGVRTNRRFELQMKLRNIKA